MKKIVKLMLSRFVIVTIIIILQFAFLIWGIELLTNSFFYVSLGLEVVNIIVLLFIINRTQTPSYKIPWIIIVLLFPVGGVFYILFSTTFISRKNKKKFHTLNNVLSRYYFDKQTCLEDLKTKDIELFGQSKYIKSSSDCPLYTQTETTYLSTGEETFALMVEKLREAKHFIFLEYFIYEKGKFWNTILGILIEKAKAGLDVRVIYDDVGSINTLPSKYYKQLEKLGIKCVAFNKYVPIASIVYNNRDHRKIMIIDGDQAFNGGINIADEYINEKKRFGYWKDSNIYIHGEAVKTFTTMFLEIWNVTRRTDVDYDRFMPSYYGKKVYKVDGFVQPFADGPRPVYDEHVGENVYLNIINNANETLYITTPYLIIDYPMILALQLAAKRGVDVRIITPKIPDKKIIFWLTRSNYLPLVEAGVKIYEYTPGFIHAKNFVCDEKVGVVGTINLDYRSLSHHFECATWLCYSSALKSMVADFQRSMIVSEEMTLEKCKTISIRSKFLTSIIGLFAPLM